MKRSLQALLFTAILALYGCNKTVVSVQDEVVSTVLNLAIDDPSTKAGQGSGNADAVNRYILEAYPEGSTVLYDRVEKLVAPGTKLTQIAINLVVGVNYRLVLWADCANDNGSDLYYRTNGPEGLRNIEMISAGMPCNDDSHDAFAASVTRKAGADLGPTIWLKRPFAQLNVISTDISEIYKEQLAPKYVTLRYSGWQNYDALNAAPTGAQVDIIRKAQPYYMLAADGSAEGVWVMAMDYILAPQDEIRIEEIGFLVDTDAQPLPWSVFENIPLRANYKTNIWGRLMTFDMSYDVIIAPQWSGEFDIY